MTANIHAGSRERMALPAGSVFEAMLEDVSKADAPAVILVRARLTSPGNPPISSRLAYAQAKIVARTDTWLGRGIRSYVLKEGHLFLSLMADGGIYEFEPIKATP